MTHRWVCNYKTLYILREFSTIKLNIIQINSGQPNKTLRVRAKYCFIFVLITSNTQKISSICNLCHRSVTVCTELLDLSAGKNVSVTEESTADAI